MNDQSTFKMDDTNRRILHDLQADGRMTNVELAARANISAPPCLRRVRALEEEGVIRGYHADVDPSPLGFKEIFFALVGLDGQSQDVLQSFEGWADGVPEIRECHMVRGGGDFILKLLARDKEHRDDLTMRLTAAEHVSNVTTFETIRTSKDEPGPPIQVEK
jgi:DNA-binding Lrp family transcriptional regulator